MSTGSTTSARLARLTPYVYILPAVLVMLAGLVLARALGLSSAELMFATEERLSATYWAN